MDISQFKHNPLAEEIVEILCKKTQNANPNFFRLSVNYYLCVVASTMRANIITKDRGSIPVNMYALNLATSGFGKGFSCNIIEEEIINLFQQDYIEQTLPVLADRNLAKLAIKRASIKGTDIADEEIDVEKEYVGTGPYFFSFDSGTPAAFKQARHKLLMCDVGALNFTCYTGDMEVLTDTGFKRFDSLNGKEQVAQMSMDSKREVTFVNPSRFIKNDYKGTLYHFISPTGVDMSVTEDHMNVVLNTQKALIKVKACDTNTAHKIVSTVFAPDTGPSKLTMGDRLLIAIQADGTIRKSGIELAFKKESKITRLRDILNQIGIKYNEAIEKRGYTRFYIPAKELNTDVDVKSLPSIFKDLLVNCNLQTAKDFIAELVKWDGNIRQNNLRYTNKYLHNVEFAQTIAVLAGLKTKIIHNPKEGYEGGYYVNMVSNHNGFHQIHQKMKSQTEFEGKTYCVTVPSGAIVLRRNGKTFVGGNCDEIGSNLVGNIDLLTSYLEAFDQGKVKNKLLKNTSDNKRVEEIEGKVPTNMLLFGTQDKLLKGDKVEEELRAMFEMGFGRRCFFGYSSVLHKDRSLTAQQIFDILTAGNMDYKIHTISDHLQQLSSISEYRKEIEVPEALSVKAIDYRMYCEDRADLLGHHEGMRKAEIGHRYYKALKLAGAYAFAEGLDTMTEAHLNSAILLAEESGLAFEKILTRDKPHVRLAKYIASMDHEVTHVDLLEDLPSYKGSASHRADLMQLAIAWGYTRQILIKKAYKHGIEFISADTLEETNIDMMTVSYSTDLALGYNNEDVPFSSLDQLLLQPGYHWVNHHLTGGHRTEANAQEGFNMVVLDIDKGSSLEEVRLLMKSYRYFVHTTKRHTDTANRFRIILPINYRLKLNKEDFKHFMLNLFEWLPFSVDDATAQRARKWETFPSVKHYYNEGELLDALPFIPHTQKNDEFKSQVDACQSLTNLERWFVMNTGKGNRSNRLIRYALLLVDSGRPIDVVRTAVHDLNQKLSDKLPAAEIDHTIMTTASKRHQEKYSE